MTLEEMKEATAKLKAVWPWKGKRYERDSDARTMASGDHDLDWCATWLGDRWAWELGTKNDGIDYGEATQPEDVVKAIRKAMVSHARKTLKMSEVQLKVKS